MSLLARMYECTPRVLVRVHVFVRARARTWLPWSALLFPALTCLALMYVRMQLTCEVYGALLGGGRQPGVGAIHAGLECGILGEKFPGMDMVSYGPTIKGAHSPDEMVQVRGAARGSYR